MWGCLGEAGTLEESQSLPEIPARARKKGRQTLASPRLPYCPLPAPASDADWPNWPEPTGKEGWVVCILQKSTLSAANRARGAEERDQRANSRWCPRWWARVTRTHSCSPRETTMVQNGSQLTYFIFKIKFYYYLFYLFLYFWSHYVACGILVPPPGSKPIFPSSGNMES